MNWLDAAPFWERLALGAVGGALVWWSATDLGAIAFRAIGLKERARSSEAAALGYALVGTAVGVLGLFHWIFTWVVIGLVLAQFIARWALGRRLPIGGPTAAIGSFKSMSALDKSAVVVIASSWLTGFVAAALPAVWWDPLAYHLPIVARAVEAHAFVVDPTMLQTSFVLLGEASALPAYIVGGSAGAAFATLGSGIVLALLCGGWAERVAAGTGRIAVALVSCSALWIWLAPSFYVDIPFAMFAVAAFRLAVEASDGSVQGAIAVVAGALAGATAATKYSGIAVVAVALLALLLARGHVKASQGARFVIAAIAVAGGWYLRTALATGDPVFPFLSVHAPGPIGSFAQRYVAMTQAWCGAGSSAADAMLLPWRMLTSPRSFCGDPGYALDLGAIFVFASLAMFRRVGPILVMCASLTAIWFFSSQQLRFLVPAVCLFAIAAAVGTTAMRENLRMLGQGALLALCFVGVAVDWIPGRLDASNSVAPALAYMAGSQSGDDYLSSRLEFYDAVRWLRAHGGERVAALDDVRDYYFGSAARWLNPYYEQADVIDWTIPARARYRGLREAGYRFLVANRNSAYLGRTPTGVDWHALDVDVTRGVLTPMFSSDDVTIYKLPDDR